MTNSTETERAKLIAERAELMAKNEAATSWGAAVGARHERIKEIDRQLAALRRLAAQEQKPFGGVGADGKFSLPNGATREQFLSNFQDVGVGTPLVRVYLSPSPAAGWNEAIEDAIIKAELCVESLTKRLDWPDWKPKCAHIEQARNTIRNLIQSLRHNAPPDTAGKSEIKLPPLTYDFTRAFPDGRVDDATYGKIETALDKIDAPIKDATGKWLSLHERIAALSHQPAPVAANSSAEAITEADIRAHVGDGMVSMQNVIDAANAILAGHASAVLNDLIEMLRALGMSDAAQPRSPHEVFQSAIAEMKRQLGNASAEARWQPIETAPKDKTIMLCVDGFQPCSGRWWPLDSCWVSFDWEGHFDTDQEMSSYVAGTCYDPTHWMPLPAPPSQHPRASDCDKQGETTKSEGGSRKQPFDPADAAGVKSGTVTFDGQTGRPTRDEVGASQTPGSSMSFAADKPIIAGQAPGPSDRTADVTKLLEFVVRADSDNTWSSNRRAIVGDARALLDAFTIGRR